MADSVFETAPDADAILKANELSANSLEAVIFLDQALTAKVTKLNLVEEHQQTLEIIHHTKKSLEVRNELLDRVSEKCWRGDAEEQQVELFKPRTFNYVDGPAIQGIKELNASLGKGNELSQITLAYDVNEDSQFNRGYVVNQQVIDENKEQHKNMFNVLDRIFHSWLVTNDMIADDMGVIFHKANEGELPKKVKREALLGLIGDPEKGLLNTANKLDPNINLSLVWSPLEGQAELKKSEASEPPVPQPGVQPSQ
jgi:hypothetical protein